jgi:hypothetical protein
VFEIDIVIHQSPPRTASLFGAVSLSLKVQGILRQPFTDMPFLRLC